jgi:hypothetical protein
MRYSILFLATAVVLAMLPAIGRADFQIGGGAAPGMGKAGLAIPYKLAGSGKMNPAAYGLLDGKLKFTWPSFRFRLQGINFSDLEDFNGTVGDGGFDQNELSRLARQFGDESIEFGAGADVALSFGGFAFSFSGDGHAFTRPNADLQGWVQSGSAGAPPLASRLDAYGVAGYEFGVAYGRRIRSKEWGGISVGARAKFVRTYYSHQFVTGTDIATNAGGRPAPEMGGQDVLDETGFGLDLGVIASREKDRGWFYGATIDNLIVPNVKFSATDPLGAPGESKPYKRAFNLGSGYLIPDRGYFALDWADLGNGAGKQELRMGGEYWVTRGFAVRAGYASRVGYSVGVGLGGFNFAYSRNLPGQFSYSLKF